MIKPVQNVKIKEQEFQSIRTLQEKQTAGGEERLVRTFHFLAQGQDLNKLHSFFKEESNLEEITLSSIDYDADGVVEDSGSFEIISDFVMLQEFKVESMDTKQFASPLETVTDTRIAEAEKVDVVVVRLGQLTYSEKKNKKVVEALKKLGIEI